MTETPVFDDLVNPPADKPGSLEVQVDLPPDPPVEQRTVLNIPLQGVQPAPVFNTIEVPNQLAPTVSTDAAGVPHVTIPLTKKTKGYIGTGVALASTAGVLAAQLLPPESGVVGWIQVGIGIIGVAATFLGIVLPTNLPITVPAAKK